MRCAEAICESCQRTIKLSAESLRLIIEPSWQEGVSVQFTCTAEECSRINLQRIKLEQAKDLGAAGAQATHVDFNEAHIQEGLPWVSEELTETEIDNFAIDLHTLSAQAILDLAGTETIPQ